MKIEKRKELKEQIGEYHYKDLLKASSWKEKTKKDFIDMIKFAANETSKINDKNQLEFLKNYYQLYLEVINEETPTIKNLKRICTNLNENEACLNFIQAPKKIEKYKQLSLFDED